MSAVFSSNTAQFLSAAGGLIAGVGQLFSARQDEDVGDFNAQILQQKAQSERNSQVLLEKQKRKIINAQIGTQIALFGKSGIKFTGSPIDVVADSLTNAEMDISIDKYNSEVRARGLENEAAIARSEGRRQAAVGFARAGSTFLSTAVNLAKSQTTLGSKGRPLGFQGPLRKDGSF